MTLVAASPPAPRTTGLKLLAGVLVSCAAARGVMAASDAGSGEHVLLPCPFRELTGLPCPLCGSTRALALVARGDAGFLHENAVVALLAIAIAIGGAVVAVHPPVAGPVRRALTRIGPGRVLLVAGLAAWAVALVNRATIAG